MSDAATIELFHSTVDAGSAAARKRVVDRGLESRIRFRNVYYAEVMTDLQARGGTAAPAIWDGARLLEGEAAVLQFLDAM
ncbi:MAG TPA: hypothetical protein VIA18_06795 [Polyangia bacterium]|jgi:hypothetical protein|nr:hypothetical protein [Polyangia bacterium]